jgi:xanthine dehydrogenase accessory factor
MFDTFISEAEMLRKRNEPFAVAIVVRRDAPSSGKVGDKAVINRFGNIFGWVGGGCVKGILVKEAEDAMRTGKPRLVRVGKTLNPSNQDGVMEYKMTCQSDGALEIFVEPVLPKPHLLVIGKSVIAKALVKLGHASGYRITGVAEGADLSTFEKVDELITQLNLANVATTASTCIVVVTQGEGDEKALSEALKKQRGYLGFVASRKKMASLQTYLADAGFSGNDIQSITAPAGLDINAKRPEDVAISILAQLVQVRQKNPEGMMDFSGFNWPTDQNDKPSPVYYINPVCGIPVDIHHPKHVIEYKGENVYFCCDGCKVKFEAAPDKYMKAKKGV